MPFAANQTHFDLLAVALNSHDRCEARLRKIDCFDLLVGPFEHLPQPEGDSLEVRREQIEIARRKGGKQSVAAGHRALLALRREHQSLSHRRLRRRASAGDEPYVRFRKRNCYVRVCTYSDRLHADQMRRRGISVIRSLSAGPNSPPTSAGRISSKSGTVRFRTLNRERSRRSPQASARPAD